MRITFTPDPAIGVDIRLSKTADIAVTPGGDIDLIGNVVPSQNVWQATALRLLTTLETYLFAEGYGTHLRQSIHAPITSALKKQIEAEVHRTILTDPRVKQINRLEVVQSADLVGFEIALSFSTISSNDPVGGVIGIGN